MATGRLTVFDREIRVASAGLTPEAISRAIAQAARNTLASILAGRPRPFRRVVDGVVGADESSVRPDGKVVYEFNFLPEIAAFALDYLRASSPVQSGRYRDSHFVMVNGERVAGPEDVPDDVTGFIITNDVPYSRKIQVGSMRNMSVPPGIYERARQEVRATYGEIVRPEVSFIELEGAYRLRRPQGRGKKRGVGGRAVGSPINYPALVVELR